MSPSIDVQILDDGSAVATVKFVDVMKNAIDPPAGATVVFASSDVNVTVTANPDGLTANINPVGPLVADATIIATATLADGVTTFTASQGVDVVADQNKPGGITLSVA